MIYSFNIVPTVQNRDKDPHILPKAWVSRNNTRLLLEVVSPASDEEAASLVKTEPGMENILIMDYWMVLPIIVMVVTSLIMRVQKHLGETWRPGEDGPILDKVGGANLPLDGGGTSTTDKERN